MKLFTRGNARILLLLGQPENTIGDIVVLANDFGVTNRKIADCVMNRRLGRMVLELVTPMERRTRGCGGLALEKLAAHARAYRFPPELLADRAALMAFLEQEGQRARERLTA